MTVPASALAAILTPGIDYALVHSDVTARDARIASLERSLGTARGKLGLVQRRLSASRQDAKAWEHELRLAEGSAENMLRERDAAHEKLNRLAAIIDDPALPVSTRLREASDLLKG